jgi:Ran-binding protein 1
MQFGDSVAADVSDGDARAETLAIRFANSESKSSFPLQLFLFLHNSNHAFRLDANKFKTAFENAQKENAEIFSKASSSGEEKKEKVGDEKVAAAAESDKTEAEQAKPTQDA